jgi:hypothetical protein
VIWTAKGGFKDQISSIYKKGVNTSSEFTQKVNHIADFLYQYGTYIALSTVLFFIIRILASIPNYASQLLDSLKKVKILGSLINTLSNLSKKKVILLLILIIIPVPIYLVFFSKENHFHYKNLYEMS